MRLNICDHFYIDCGDLSNSIEFIRRINVLGACPRIEAVLRESNFESGRILAALVNYCKDLEQAEDALQEAYVEALTQWRNDNIPVNKGSWLLTVAKRKLIDRIRKQNLYTSQQTIERIIDSQPETLQDELNQPIPDERLKLIFICCHPALKQEAQVALTLKTLCGLKVAEIARAFLTS